MYHVYTTRAADKNQEDKKKRRILWFENVLSRHWIRQRDGQTVGQTCKISAERNENNNSPGVVALGHMCQ